MLNIKVLLNFFKKENQHDKQKMLKEKIKFVVMQDSEHVDNKKQDDNLPCL